MMRQLRFKNTSFDLNLNLLVHFKSSVIAACLLRISWGVVGSEALELLLLCLLRFLLNLVFVRNYLRSLTGAA